MNRTRRRAFFSCEAELPEDSHCAFLAQDIEHDLFQPSEIVGREVFAHGGRIFAEIDVEHPVPALFDTSVGTSGLGKGFSRHQTRRGVIAAFQIRWLAAYDAQGFDRRQHHAVKPARRIHFARLGGYPGTLDD